MPLSQSQWQSQQEQQQLSSVEYFKISPDGNVFSLACRKQRLHSFGAAGLMLNAEQSSFSLIVMSACIWLDNRQLCSGWSPHCCAMPLADVEALSDEEPEAPDADAKTVKVKSKPKAKAKATVGSEDEESQMSEADDAKTPRGKSKPKAKAKAQKKAKAKAKAKAKSKKAGKKAKGKKAKAKAKSKGKTNDPEEEEASQDEVAEDCEGQGADYQFIKLRGICISN